MMLLSEAQDYRIPEEEIEALAGRLDGNLIRPGNTDYEEARAVWNGMIDRYPAFIVRAASVEDVVTAVNFARDNSLLLSVRGGGHNVAGHGTNDGGLVIDLSGLKEIEVDPIGRRVRAGGGVTIGELDAATQPFGLAVPMGVVSPTGIAGLTLGGGFGWLSRKYGMSAENLIAAEVVTADGRIVHASETENSDLLWGLRGGGGNFGIVTSFEYTAHPVGPDVMLVFVFHDGSGDNMKRAIQFYRDFSASSPEEVSGLLATGIVPPDEHHYPVELHNRPFVLFAAMYVGPTQLGQRILQPLIDFGKPLLDFSGVRPFVEAQQMFDAEYPNGLRYYWKSLNLAELNDEIIDRIVKHARLQPSPFSTIDLWPIGDVLNRPGAANRAFDGRQAKFLINPEANWVEPADDEANIAWARNILADLEEFSDGGRYLNFAGFQEEGNAMMRGAFGDRYQRLLALKRKYDPQNLFRLNQNINPLG